MRAGASWAIRSRRCWRGEACADAERDRGRAQRYEQVARTLLRTAEDLSALADGRYGNALAILGVHAAIAYTDALTVAYRGLESTDGDHAQAAAVLQHALGSGAPADQVRRLRGILGAKSHASYSGTFYTLEEGERLLAQVRLYAAWATEMLRRRPV